MLARILSLPFFVILLGIAAISMYVPAAHAAIVENFKVMRAFFQSGNMMLILTSFVALATAGNRPGHRGRNHLLAMLATFAGLPLALAVPFRIAVPDTTFLNAYFEMVSSITTTGATLFEDPARLPPSVHLWRGLVGWLGGLFVLVTAVAILAPMSLGGFEVLAPARSRRRDDVLTEASWASDPSARLVRYTVRVLPIYGTLTVALWVALLLLGDSPLVALVHAMSVISTSGISPVGGLAGGGSGIAGEAVVLVFLLPALSRQFVGSDQPGEGVGRFLRDPELRLGLLLVGVLSFLLFIRHWAGAFGVQTHTDIRAAAAALWGSVFTTLSFLTTTGFESSDWTEARNWSGLPAPGIVLIGLALIGGGVATTAGGVKLLRMFALYKHGVRELDRLVHPSSVGAAGRMERRFRRQGAYVAWIFFMLFALALAIVVLGLGLTGQSFEGAVTLGTAAISTTGPLAATASGGTVSFTDTTETARLILAAAMVLGRLETLAIIALLNPGFWRG